MSTVTEEAIASKRSGASFARGGSRQDYGTPREFIAAVEARFGKLDFDLAATKSNTVAPRFYAPVEEPEGAVAVDALAQDWTQLRGLLWLNPPFSNIAPWAQMCLAGAVPSGIKRHARKRTILLLVPAAVGANWWLNFVHDKARVYFLNGRLAFDGKNGYPKDCALVEYGARPGYEVWNWRLPWKETAL